MLLPTTSPKSPILAALLSFFFFGGAGQIYLGQAQKGTYLMMTILFGGGGWAYVMEKRMAAGNDPSVIEMILWLVAVGFVVIVGTIDAFLIGRKMKRGQPVGEKEWF